MNTLVGGTQALPSGGSQWQLASCLKDATSLYKIQQTAATLVLMAAEIPTPPPHPWTLAAFIPCYMGLKV